MSIVLVPHSSSYSTFVHAACLVASVSCHDVSHYVQERKAQKAKDEETNRKMQMSQACDDTVGSQGEHVTDASGCGIVVRYRLVGGWRSGACTYCRHRPLDNDVTVSREVCRASWQVWHEVVGSRSVPVRIQSEKASAVLSELMSTRVVECAKQLQRGAFGQVRHARLHKHSVGRIARLGESGSGAHDAHRAEHKIRPARHVVVEGPPPAQRIVVPSGRQMSLRVPLQVLLTFPHAQLASSALEALTVQSHQRCCGVESFSALSCSLAREAINALLGAGGTSATSSSSGAGSTCEYAVSSPPLPGRHVSSALPHAFEVRM